MAEKAQPTPSPFDAQAEAEAPSTEASPWDEPPAAFGGETRAFPRMSFEEMEKLAAKPAAAADPAWAPAEEKQADPFAEPAPSESPFAAAETPEPAPAAESSWSPEPAQSEAKESDLVNSQITDTAAAPGDLTDAQIDRIARRVVQLMSDQVIRNIAWEVIPDLAEMVVKERIKQLEAEA